MDTKTILHKHLKIDPDFIMIASERKGQIELDLNVQNPQQALFYLHLLQKQISKLIDLNQQANTQAMQSQGN